VAGTSLWNSLAVADSSQDLDLSRDNFRRLLETLYLRCTEAFSILELFQESGRYVLQIDLLTYLKGNAIIVSEMTKSKGGYYRRLGEKQLKRWDFGCFL